MPGRLEFDVNLGRPAQRRDPGEPMRLVMLGDFSGKPSSERSPLANRPTHRVDLDSIDTVIKRLGPSLDLPGGEIAFDRIDDFHPDRLYARLERFQALRHARDNPQAGTDDLLGRLLGKPTTETAAPANSPVGGLDALIHKIVDPHVVKDSPPQAKLYSDATEAAIAEEMRGVLHHPAFQALESVWRGVQWWVSSVELDDNLQLHIFDVSRDEIIADVVAARGQLAQTGLYRALVDRWRNVPGAESWSALVALIQFGPSDADIGLLAALGLIAAQAGGPLLAGADAALGDTQASEGGWGALRRSEAARWIGLAAPRVLLRLPYGKRSDPIESFPFEEFVGPPAHEHLLWGPSSFATSILIGRAFTSRGWDMEPGDEREIGDLPAYVFEQDGERAMQACAERYLTESEIQRLIEAGLIPIASRRDRNAIVAIRFQSVSNPTAPLAW